MELGLRDADLLPDVVLDHAEAVAGSGEDMEEASEEDSVRDSEEDSDVVDFGELPPITKHLIRL